MEACQVESPDSGAMGPIDCHDESLCFLTGVVHPWSEMEADMHIPTRDCTRHLSAKPILRCLLYCIHTVTGADHQLPSSPHAAPSTMAEQMVLESSLIVQWLNSHCCRC